jgi:hypothetical protein
MLFKATSPEASSAVLAIGGGAIDKAPAPAADIAVTPSAEESRIAALERANAALERALAELLAGWDEALLEAQREARKQAKLDHVGSDEQQLAVLERSLDQLHETFKAKLEGDCAKLAQALALVAFERLVEASASEREWLSRVIKRRLHEISASSTVVLQVPAADLAGGLGERLAGAMPAGTSLEVLAELREGTARVEFALGSVEIDPRAAVDRIAALLGSEVDHA